MKQIKVSVLSKKDEYVGSGVQVACCSSANGAKRLAGLKIGDLSNILFANTVEVASLLAGTDAFADVITRACIAVSAVVDSIDIALICNDEQQMQLIWNNIPSKMRGDFYPQQTHELEALRAALLVEQKASARTASDVVSILHKYPGVVVCGRYKHDLNDFVRHAEEDLSIQEHDGHIHVKMPYLGDVFTTEKFLERFGDVHICIDRCVWVFVP